MTHSILAQSILAHLLICKAELRRDDRMAKSKVKEQESCKVF